jgi:hypothetical protein
MPFSFPSLLRVFLPNSLISELLCQPGQQAFNAGVLHRSAAHSSSRQPISSRPLSRGDDVNPAHLSFYSLRHFVD